MAAGFRNVVLPLGLSAVTARGFRSVIPVLPYGGGVPVGSANAGFRSVIPVLPMGAGLSVSQAGFVSAIPILNLGATEGIIVIPDQAVYPPGTSRRRRLEEEDEMMLAMIMAFLEMKQ